MQYKAVSLISGGLDSLLATKLILEQNIYVEGINFFTGFTGDHNDLSKLKKYANGAKAVCNQLGITLNIINIVDTFKPILMHPKYGYGSHLNPCLDCKLFMIMQAKRWMEENKFDFLITGEVLGQRPKSQRSDTLPIASLLTSDLIVRPLSAKLLPQTVPEKNKWINRELLCNFSGRSRKPQILLAKKYGFNHIPQPGGGCVLTDYNFCNRLKDLLSHREEQNYTEQDILMLHVGHHIRINSRLKIIIGRNESENRFLNKYLSQTTGFQTYNYPGALLLIDGQMTIENEIFICKLSAYFSQGRSSKEVKVIIYSPIKEAKIISVIPLLSSDIVNLHYL